MPNHIIHHLVSDGHDAVAVVEMVRKRGLLPLSDAQPMSPIAPGACCINPRTKSKIEERMAGHVDASTEQLTTAHCTRVSLVRVPVAQLDLLDHLGRYETIEKVFVDTRDKSPTSQYQASLDVLTEEAADHLKGPALIERSLVDPNSLAELRTEIDRAAINQSIGWGSKRAPEPSDEPVNEERRVRTRRM